MYVIKHCGKKMAKRLFQNYWYETILKWKQKKNLVLIETSQFLRTTSEFVETPKVSEVCHEVSVKFNMSIYCDKLPVHVERIALKLISSFRYTGIK